MKKLRMKWQLAGAGDKKRAIRSFLCVMMGILLFFAAEAVDSGGGTVENGRLPRNPCGKGDRVYEFYVDGLELSSEVNLLVPEQRMTKAEFQERIPEIAEVLCGQICGANESLSEVRTDLRLVKELQEFGVTIRWESENPEVISTMGNVNWVGAKDQEDSKGIEVYLHAAIKHGLLEELVEIPVSVYPPEESLEERFLKLLEQVVLQNPEEGEVLLPTEFEGKTLSYRAAAQSKNVILVLLGVTAAICLALKDKQDAEVRKKEREYSLREDYADFVSEFLILTGAGHSAKSAWKKLTQKYQTSKMRGDHPLCEEMQVAVNQMETGIPETRVYAEFGRRCGLQCYVRFASLLESSINTGGKYLRKRLEEEMEEAFQQKIDFSKRKGEELSSKLLLPMFGILSVVMVLVAAPAFLSF